MLEELRRNIGYLIARLHFGAADGDPVSFTRSVSDARHALLVLPFEPLDLAVIAPVLDTLRQKFHDRHITVVTTMHSVELMRSLPQGRFVRIDQAEITPFFLPRAKMLQRMPRPDYDLAIDLNLDFKLPSGYICRASKARVRIGFAGSQSDVFYNFQVQTTPVPGRRQLYERFAACLEMF
jgi:ADP-heptose:LPS heptosyltransferase